MACRPGFVRGPKTLGRPFIWTRAHARVLAIHHGRRGGGDPLRVEARDRPNLILLPAGLAVPPLSPGARWSLAPPFHPCRPTPRGADGGLFSVALSLGFPRPGVTRRRASVEPGPSSAPARLSEGNRGRPAIRRGRLWRRRVAHASQGRAGVPYSVSRSKSGSKPPSSSPGRGAETWTRPEGPGGA